MKEAPTGAAESGPPLSAIAEGRTFYRQLWPLVMLQGPCQKTVPKLTMLEKTRQSTYGINDAGQIVGSFNANTPLPAALPLFATGLGAMGRLSWRRSGRTPAAVAA
jgi:hypothetical protein